MSKTLVGGFVSVKSIIESSSREIYRIIFEKNRYDSVMRSDLRKPEQRQYKTLMDSGVKFEFASPDEYCFDGSGGIVAEVGERRFTPADGVFSIPNGYIVMLDGIEDPFNFAYSLRSLYAAGVDAVIIPKHNFYESSDIVIRSSAGASELLNVCCVDDLAEAARTLKSKGYLVVSTAKNEKAKDLHRVNLNKPLCLVFGGEKRGIKKEIIDLSDMTLKLKYPRDCHYSLPACCAVSVISFEIGEKFALPSRRTGK